MAEPLKIQLDAATVERLLARLERLAPEYELLTIPEAAAEFKLSKSQAASIANRPDGPRKAVCGERRTKPLISRAEWVAFFKREEQKRGSRA